MNEWYVDSSPGTAINTPPSMCGFLVPSVGVSGSGTVTGEWGPIPDAVPMLTAGTTLPNAPYSPAFIALNEAPYFNGFSMLSNCVPQGLSTTSFSFSVWYNLQGTSGAYMNTSIPSFSITSGREISQSIGEGFIHSGAASKNIFNPTANGWFHFMYATRSGGGGTVWINDTEIAPGTESSAVAQPLATLAFGGNAQLLLNAPGTLLVLNSATGQLPSQGYGLTAGVAELWWDTTFIDWTVAANRQKFHTTDLAALRYAPVSLGKQGQLPTGSRPKLYLSGTPKQFKINRATGLQITTYNVGGNSLFTQKIDPSLVQLDPLPATIGPVT